MEHYGAVFSYQVGVVLIVQQVGSTPSISIYIKILLGIEQNNKPYLTSLHEDL